MSTKKHTARYNTPCSPAWDDEWIKRVEERERTIGRACCGARMPDGNPCHLPPNHKNGRCKYHGGFDCTGAQPGNRNGVIHGLYARGLQQCGEHCPLWGKCAVPDENLERLSPKSRPACPFEATQFQMSLTDADDRLNRIADADGIDRQTAHHMALLLVMIQRAATALSVTPFTETDEIHGPNEGRRTTRINPAFNAYMRLSSEYRRFLNDLNKRSKTYPRDAEIKTDKRRRDHDQSLNPEDQQQSFPPENRAQPRALAIARDAAESVEYIRTWRDRLQKTQNTPNHDPADIEKQKKKIQQLEELARQEYQTVSEMAPELFEELRQQPKHDPRLFPQAGKPDTSNTPPPTAEENPAPHASDPPQPTNRSALPQARGQ